MVLSEQQITKLLQEPRNADNIAAGAKLQNDHRVHITGEGYEALVKYIEGYESNKDFLNVKKQVAKPATILITSTIIDNLNRWTSAQGTVKKANFNDTAKNKQFQKVLASVWNGKSFEDFINTFYKEAIYILFNGFVLVTKPKLDQENKLVEKEGIISKWDEGNLDPYIIFIDINDVHDYYLTGDKVEYLIIKLDKENKKFRVIDDQKDIIVNLTGDKVKYEEPVLNEFGYVPARMVSNITEKLLNNQVKTSPINHIIPGLDRYFSCDVDLRMQFIKHNYPKLAAVTRECTECHGQGYAMDNETKISCNTCDGTGREVPIRRDGIIGLPSSLLPGDTPYPGSPASYITPEVESLKVAVEDLKQQRIDLLYAGTGDKNLIAESLNTATENMINSRSLEDRIAEISKMVEQFEEFILNSIKDMHKDFASISDFEISVKYGKKIALKNEDELLKEIEQAKKSGMNFSYIQSLQADLIYVRYKNNKTELERQLLLNDIEPFAGFSLEEILKLEKYIEDKELKLKVNFESLIDKLEEKEPIQFMESGEGYKSRINKIKEQLYTLIPEKKIEEKQPILFSKPEVSLT